MRPGNSGIPPGLQNTKNKGLTPKPPRASTTVAVIGGEVDMVDAAIARPVSLGADLGRGAAHVGSIGPPAMGWARW
ncbi:hypothetical protein KAX17_03865 [Candidatus Bipolaricaulota bacterium]|nr:hypothetical protein [Candidatus Bipolaricaulota bacterium]